MQEEAYEIRLIYPQAVQILNQFNPEEKTSIINTLRELSRTIRFLRRTYPTAYSRITINHPIYIGIDYFVDHNLEAIFILNFVERPLDNPLG